MSRVNSSNRVARFAIIFLVAGVLLAANPTGVKAAVGLLIGPSGGTGQVITASGGQVGGLNSTPINADHAVPLGYLQANYSPTAGNLWSGTLNGTIYNGTAGAGSVGIGTTTPSEKLGVIGNIGLGSSGIIGSGAGYSGGSGAANYATLQLYSGATGYTTLNNQGYGIKLQTSGSDRLTILNGGNVGIGIAPLNKLDVDGNIIIGRQLDTLSRYIGKSTVTGAIGGSQSTSWMGFISDATNDYITFGTHHSGVSAGERVRINSDGNVGIGITSPTRQLEISSNDNTLGGVLRLSNPRVTTLAEDAVGTLEFYSNDADTPKIAGYIKTVARELYGREAALTFGVSKAINTSATEAMRIDENGSVGIGTTNPGALLNVNGRLMAGGVTSDIGNPTHVLMSTGGTAIQYAGSVGNYLLINPGDANTTLSLKADARTGAYPPMDFWTSNQSRLMILASGNVGIGTTTPSNLFQVSGGTGQVMSVSGGQIGGLNSTPINADQAVPLGYLQANYAPIGTGAGAAFVQGGNSFGATATLGTNDNNTLNFETNNGTKMTILAGGNVGIGTTSPTSLLEIYKSSGGTYWNEGIKVTRGSVPTQYGLISYNGGALRLGSVVEGGGTNGWIYFDRHNAGSGTPSTSMVIDNSGNVGIGTTGPTSLLHLNVASGDNLIKVNTQSSASNWIGMSLTYLNSEYFAIKGNVNSGELRIGGISPSGYYTTIYSNGAQTMSVSGGNVNFPGSGIWNSSGNVGIGTSSPGGNSLAVSKDAGSSALVYFNSQNAANGYGLALTSAASNAATYALHIYRGGNQNNSSFWVGTSGNVGIGTTTPSNLFQVSGGTGQVISVAGGQIGGLNSTPINTDQAVPLGYLQANYAPIGTGAGAAFVQGGNSFGATASLGTNDNNNLNIETNNTTRMTVLAGGNVGIGTAAPNYLLTVDRNTSGTPTSLLLRLANSGGTNTPEALFQIENEVVHGFGLHGRSGVGNLDKLIQFWNLNTGNVGIGTTNPLSKLEVNGDAIVRGTLSAYDMTGGAGDRYLFRGVLSGAGRNIVTILSNAQNGVINIYDTAEILTTHFSGNSASYINGGNVGIGTTNPQRKLDLYDAGAIRFSTSATGGAQWGEIQFTPAGDNSMTLYTNGAYTTNSIILKPGNVEVMRAVATGNIGIGTTTPTNLLHVNAGTGQAMTVAGGQIGGLNSTPINTDQAVPLGYLQNNYLPKGSGVATGDLNMGHYNILNVNKLTVDTIDPLYTLNGTNYSTYASSISGGVKEEYVGRAVVAKRTANNEYEKVIDFGSEPEGSDLWVWHQVVDYSSENVEVLLTPYGNFANTYYLIKNNKLIFRSDRPVTLSYRLIGRRFDWLKWPTKALDQTEKGMMVTY